MLDPYDLSIWPKRMAKSTVWLDVKQVLEELGSYSGLYLAV